MRSVGSVITLRKMVSLGLGLLVCNTLSACSILNKDYAINEIIASSNIDDWQLMQAISGSWDVSYQVAGGRTLSSKMMISTDGHRVIGSGHDLPYMTPFTIENFKLKDQDLSFIKAYKAPENPNIPPVVYCGKINYSAEREPVVRGDYYQIVSGQRKEGCFTAAIQSRQEQPQASVNRDTTVQKAQIVEKKEIAVPELSGRWESSYEADFRLNKLVLYLEQNRSELKGHGYDTLTKSEIVVSGNYHYPDVELRIQSARGKSNYGQSKNSRESFNPSALVVRSEVKVNQASIYRTLQLDGSTNAGGKFIAKHIE